VSPDLISAVLPSRLPAGVLADGTVYYAPIGEVVVTGALVTCHLCGRSMRSVTAHLRVHGWTKLDYCEAFGLERGSPWRGRRPASSARPASVVVAAAGAGHVRATTALTSAERSPALTAARTVTRLAWPASRCAGGAGDNVNR
jgi:hypothetical protein